MIAVFPQTSISAAEAIACAYRDPRLHAGRWVSPACSSMWMPAFTSLHSAHKVSPCGPDRPPIGGDQRGPDFDIPAALSKSGD